MMTFTGRTPEALLSRNDSKLSSTTCRGITSSGRPCRRTIASSKLAPVAQIARNVDPIVGNASFDTRARDVILAGYCWQHKAQADNEEKRIVPPIESSGHVALRRLNHRSSIDTLVARLGILDLDHGVREALDSVHVNRKAVTPRRRRSDTKTSRQALDVVINPVGSVVSAKECTHARNRMRPTTSINPGLAPIIKRSPRKSPGLFAALCFGGGVEDDYMEVVRHRHRSGQSSTRPESHRVARPHDATEKSSPPRGASSEEAAHENNRPIPSTQTAQFLALIPRNLTPQLTSLLLGELSKPISPYDEEGFIYIFWLTETTSKQPSATEAASLLGESAQSSPGRRANEIIRNHATKSDNGSSEKKILLKIGRTSNVHRRMSEWTRQCGYSLSLLRFYPYISPSQSSSSDRMPDNASPQRNPPRKSEQRESGGVRMVPHAHRVERLIHIELADKRIKRSCDVCAKEHREWFEVGASRESVGDVDSVIRRWVSWAETR